ncbi:MAG: hypothetical protein JOZ90_05110 [Alphaproteobacteria bacterium]|nr:hypothetical protein [Alphaproteobacteria bacterium]MBV9372844.1 hypothetical protein [Alphaproteobacteria bacterium]MBV9900461.1 hypothetical protein [Alphaproteobacteria bacterium]
MRLWLLPLLLPLLPLTAGCEAKKPDWAEAGGAGNPLPAKVCAEVGKALAALGKGAAEYNDKGEATVPTEAFLQMPPAQRDQLAKALAYHASCAAGATSEAQPVLIRGDDGSTLLRTTISTDVDLGDLTGGE